MNKSKNTPLLPRADGKGGVFDIRGVSAYSDKSIVGNIIPDGMGEAFTFKAIFFLV